MSGPHNDAAPGVGAPRAASRIESNTFKNEHQHSTGTIADKLLDRLDGVKQTGPDRWVACCPAHEDHSPSLAIREIDTRLLIHCFSGCDVADVVAAVGLELSDLFPPRDREKHSRKSISRPFPAADILKCLAHESLFVLLVAEAILKGEKLEEWDKERLLQSASRFRAALNTGGLS